MNYAIYEKIENPVGDRVFEFRTEQKDAINSTFKYYRQGKESRFLWNAKMRFGKTTCALELFRELATGTDLDGKQFSEKEFPSERRARRMILVTHRPVVDSGWQADFERIFKGMPEYRYISQSDDNRSWERQLSGAEEDMKGGRIKGYIFFSSLQYLALTNSLGGRGGSNENNQKLKDRILDTSWDFVVVDEAHEGTQTDLGQGVTSRLLKHKDGQYEKLPYHLWLSGTSFNILDKFEKSNTYTWDYHSEQEAKKKWFAAHKDENPELNPYIVLPRLNLLTFNMEQFDFYSGMLAGGMDDAKSAYFNFSEFFRVWNGREGNFRQGKHKLGELVHKDAVMQFLDRLCESGKDTNYPFSNDIFQEGFHHTFWVVSEVSHANALEKALKEHEVFKDFEIINVAGTEGADDALGRVKNAATSQSIADGKYSITISCGRLTTGVTIPHWTAVLLLYGNSVNTSLSSYMQTIFRVQTPAEYTVDGTRYRKANAYVFDFVPMRTYKSYVNMAVKVNREKSESTREAQQDYIRQLKDFMPCISLDGGVMTEVDVNTLFEHVNSAKIDRILESGFGTNDIFNMDAMTDAHIADKDWLKLFENVGKIPGAKLSSRKKPKSLPEQPPSIPVPDNKSDNELTDKEGVAKKEIKKRREEQRKRADILRGVAYRIPLMLYGGAPKDAEITVDNLTEQIDDCSWAEFMPQGFTKEDFKIFSKCFDASLFLGAGKRYRELIQAADDMFTVRRIQEIARIFSWLHNPDKEKVLTPWRVVNMHLGKTIGGYRFFEEDFETPLETPVEVRQDCSPEVFEAADEKGDMNTRILEINSKTGLYPLYVAYTLYRKNIEQYCKKHHIKEGGADDENNLSVSEQHSLWDEVVERHLYVVCNTAMAERITWRTLMGFRRTEKMKEQKHIQSIELVKEAQENKGDLSLKLRNPRTWGDTDKKGAIMFNAVVGNPPYQVEGNNTRSAPIYPLFFDIAFSLSDKVTLITPGRFLFKAGEASKKWMEKMLADEHLKVVAYHSKSTDCFETVDIKGGIAITYRDEKKKLGPIGDFCSSYELGSILKNVSSHADFVKGKFAELISSRGMYRFNESFFKENPVAEEAMNTGTGNMITSRAFELYQDIFVNTPPRKF